METVISRDTDVLREYVAALDANERGLSPFASLAATVKLSRLRRELNSLQLEATEDDVVQLRREISDRLNRSILRRIQARPWAARISLFLMIVIGQQLLLAVVWLLTMLFVRFARVPKLWNPVLPHEQPAFLFAFIFFFFFATPMLALLAVFGGRYFRAWRVTLTSTILILVMSALATYLVVRNKEAQNPVRHTSSLSQFMKDREVNAAGYDEWLASNWLMKDARFKRDYERYLRNGPGRWITSRFDSGSDAAWSGALATIGEYLDTGHDPAGFREWLKYYYDRNRISSEDRIDEEVSELTSAAGERYLGVWQVEPYLKERDQRLYRAYLGSIDDSMKKWGVGWLAILILVFSVAYITTSFSSFFTRRLRRASPTGESERISFPERSNITTPSFYDSTMDALSRVHRSFLRLAVFSSVFVFLFWAVIYAWDLSGERANPRT